MDNSKIYVEVLSMNFWWTLYGLTDRQLVEDIIIYEKENNSFKEIISTRIYTKGYLQKLIDDLSEEQNENDFKTKIKKFVKGEEIKFHHYYDDPNDEDFFEVPFEAEKNEENVKPSFIEIWHPGDDIDIKVIKDSVALFSKEYLNRTPEEVTLKEVITYDKANKLFLEKNKRISALSINM